MALYDLVPKRLKYLSGTIDGQKIVAQVICRNEKLRNILQTYRKPWTGSNDRRDYSVLLATAYATSIKKPEEVANRNGCKMRCDVKSSTHHSREKSLDR